MVESEVKFAAAKNFPSKSICNHFHPPGPAESPPPCCLLRTWRRLPRPGKVPERCGWMKGWRLVYFRENEAVHPELEDSTQQEFGTWSNFVWICRTKFWDLIMIHPSSFPTSRTTGGLPWSYRLWGPKCCVNEDFLNSFCKNCRNCWTHGRDLTLDLADRAGGKISASWTRCNRSVALSKMG